MLHCTGRRVQPYICYRRECGLELAMLVFLVLSMLYPNGYTNRICKGHEDLPSSKAVLEAIKFEKKPSCVKMDF